MLLRLYYALSISYRDVSLKNRKLHSLTNLWFGILSSPCLQLQLR